MIITVSKSAGFCFGVKCAVEMAKSYAETSNNGELRQVYTYGKIIHNDYVVDGLKRQNVVPIEDIENLPSNSIVIIRAHGISPIERKTLQELGNEIVDATCPYVAKIHKIASDDYAKGRQIVIVGDAEHPEVKGINGCCDNSAWIVGADLLEYGAEGTILSQLTLTAPLPKEPSVDLPLSIIAQTTIRQDLYEKVVKILKKRFTNIEIYDTICNATIERQRDSAELAKNSDVCLVIGGRDSSNTTKLFEVCKDECENTFKIEGSNVSDELKKIKNYIKINTNTKVGVTAGASTPAEIIEEVVKVMEEMNKSFEEALEETLKPLTMGDIVKGMVIGITPTEVQVDLGVKSDGIIPIGELSDDPNYKIEDDIKIGQEVEVFVFRVSDVEGVIGLSRKKIDSIKGFKEVEAALETKEILKGRVVEIVNGGVIVLCKGAQVFIPASQAADRYIEDLGILLNEEVSFRVIDIAIRRGKKRILGSIRAVAREVREAANDAFWGSAEVGQKFSGKVKTIMDFGAFVDIGGIDGLVHVSELSWQKVKHPSDVLSVGDVVEVYIKLLDKEKSKISLGYKKMEDNPWVIAANKIAVGDTITCKVVRIVPFGAFAEIMPHVDGLIHISQISWQHIAKPSDELSIGQEVEAKVLSINTETRQISLSIKELLDQPVMEAPVAAEESDEEKEPTSYTEESSFTVGDVLDSMIDDTAEAVEAEVIVDEKVAEEIAEPAVEEATE